MKEVDIKDGEDIWLVGGELEKEYLEGEVQWQENYLKKGDCNDEK